MFKGSSHVSRFFKFVKIKCTRGRFRVPYPFGHIVSIGLVRARNAVPVDARDGQGQHELQQTQSGVEDDFRLQKMISEIVHLKQHTDFIYEFIRSSRIIVPICIFCSSLERRSLSLANAARLKPSLPIIQHGGSLTEKATQCYRKAERVINGNGQSLVFLSVAKYQRTNGKPFHDPRSTIRRCGGGAY